MASYHMCGQLVDVYEFCQYKSSVSSSGWLHNVFLLT